MKFQTLAVLFASFVSIASPAHAARIADLQQLSDAKMEAASKALQAMAENIELQHDSLGFGEFKMQILAVSGNERIEQTLKQMVYRQRVRGSYAAPDSVEIKAMAKTAANLNRAAGLADEIEAATGPLSDSTVEQMAQFRSLFRQAARQKHVDFFMGSDGNEFGSCESFALVDRNTHQVWSGHHCVSE